MDSELMIAAVGGGSALLGAAIGGAAAVLSAHIQGKRTAEAARSAHSAAIDVARRHSQRERYDELLGLAHAYEVQGRQVLPAARSLIEYTESHAANEPPLLSEAELRDLRASVVSVGTPKPVVAAVQKVGLEGPASVSDAALVVGAAATTFAKMLSEIEKVRELEGGEYLGLTQPWRLEQAHTELWTAISEFSTRASQHLNRQQP